MNLNFLPQISVQFTFTFLGEKNLENSFFGYEKFQTMSNYESLKHNQLCHGPFPLLANILLGVMAGI